MTSLQPEAVARSFSRRADSYDNAAILQTQAGATLLAMIKPHGICLDLGCGTGRYTRSLQAQPAVSACYGLDIAAGMLAQAKRHSPPTIQWLQANALALPLPDNSVDTVYSSLMAQWLGPMPSLFAEVRRVLQPGGCFAVSTLLPGTLHEIKTAWQQVDKHQHVNHFEPSSAWQAAAARYFRHTHWQQQTIVRQFTTVIAALRELKQLGASNINHQRPPGLISRQRFTRFVNACENYRHNGLLPTTYKLLYGVLYA